MPSGYNCFAAAMMHSGHAFFRTDYVSFDLTAGTLTRHYHRFSDHIRDAINGRILTGYHFRSARRPGRLGRPEGRPMGRSKVLRTGRRLRPSVDPRPARARRGSKFWPR
jgi:hypothetical protein